MKTKTSELIGPALDWAVAKAERLEIPSLMGGAVWAWVKDDPTQEDETVCIYRPSTDWSQGGPIIEQEKIDLLSTVEESWQAYLNNNEDDPPLIRGIGPTPLIAAMRCYVASKLGDEVEVPDELA